MSNLNIEDPRWWLVLHSTNAVLKTRHLLKTRRNRLYSDRINDHSHQWSVWLAKWPPTKSKLKVARKEFYRVLPLHRQWLLTWKCYSYNLNKAGDHEGGSFSIQVDGVFRLIWTEGCAFSILMLRRRRQRRRFKLGVRARWEFSYRKKGHIGLRLRFLERNRWMPSSVTDVSRIGVKWWDKNPKPPIFFGLGFNPFDRYFLVVLLFWSFPMAASFFFRSIQRLPLRTPGTFAVKGNVAALRIGRFPSFSRWARESFTFSIAIRTEKKKILWRTTRQKKKRLFSSIVLFCFGNTRWFGMGFQWRIPVELGCCGASLFPFHSAVAAAKMTSRLSLASRSNRDTSQCFLGYGFRGP